MKMSAFFAGLCFGFLFLVSTAPAAEPETPAEKKSAGAGLLSLEESVTDLLETIKDEAPDVYRRMEAMPRKEALARIMRALDSGVIPADQLRRETKPQEAAPGPPPVYKNLELGGKRLLYIRLDSLTKETAAEAAKPFRAAVAATLPKPDLTEDSGAENADPDAPSISIPDTPAYTILLKKEDVPFAYSGVIFDLRSASSGEFDNAEALAEATKAIPVPVMALVSGTTDGPGELFAAFLRRDSDASILGEATAGSIFPVKRIYVDDTAWFLPRLKPIYFGISPYAVEPDAVKKSAPQIPFFALEKNPANLDADPLLRLAVDLLTAKAAVRPQTPPED